jgi:NAD(P)-dependent dehydrogenase (short-subunit alcohol dehydrogenase family)
LDFNQNRMNNKVVLITGGSSGIGKSIGEFLHHKGFIVYGTSRNPEKIVNSVFPLVALDVRNSDSIHAAVAKIIAVSGRLDVVINNAGVGITGALEEIPMEEIKNNFETNFFGPIEVMKAVLPQMRSQESGLIINITSIAGYMGLPYRSIYSASKGALELITEALRMEVKYFGIDITNVAPGDFATNIASGRFHAPLLKGSAYEVPYGNTLKMMDEHVDSGSNPNEMAEAVYKIIASKEPRIHYKVGVFMQKFSIVLKRILPDKVYEKMLMNHYKL